MSAAYHIKTMHPNARVVVFERDFVSQGASTRNAGFACFGSPSEILADLVHQTKEDVFSTMFMRWEGLGMLKEIIAEKDMDFHQKDGFEIFLKDDIQLWNDTIEKMEGLNDMAEDYIGFRPYVVCDNHWNFSNVQAAVRIKGEGILDPGKMILSWQSKCTSIGVEFRYGLSIDTLELKDPSLVIRGNKIDVGNIVVCTNGFAKQLIPELDVIPARNQVLVTGEILDVPWNQSFHFREGYVYLRSIGKRVLIGGGRDLFMEQESTDVMAENKENQQYLKDFLMQLLGKKDVKVDYTWSGIMGMGKSKGPIIEKLNDGVYVGVRMGGMGVAIGTWVGKKLADLTL